MTGKAYTMKEMKGIVNYIVDHKTYGEIRGRKMWMDYAKSKETTRTWQSLKETFLKRILPDIHNPYYGLQLTQIASFRQGSDVEANNSNKLNVEPVDKGPGSPATSGENGHDRIEKDVENNKDQNKEQNTSGEDPNIDELDNVRASTETHILDPCYGSADDIRKDLEQSDQERALDPKGEAPVATAVVPNNTVKVNSSDEENIDTLTKAVQKAADQQQEIAIELSDSEENQVKQNGQADNMEAKAAQKEETNLNIPTEKEKDKENSINTSKSILSGNEVTSEKIKSTKNIKDTPNNSNTIDTQLPNNPEELDKSKENNKEVAEPKRNKKRAASQEMIISKRKKLLNKQSASDTDAIKHISKNVIPEDPSEKQDEPISHDGQVINLETLSDTNEANVRTNELEVILEKNPENPYSKSVKVHEEQYSCTINSESDNVEITKEPKKTVKPKKPVPIPVTSISNLSSTTDNPGENIPKLGIVRKKQRDNALGHAFGFSTGEVSRNNKRRHSYTKKRVLHPTLNISSDTSDASSMSDSDFISPPRGKKHKGHTKYVKPKSLRMRTLDEDGGLFVMQGKRIFPFVTDGKNLKKFLSYEPDDSDEESYWKLKYIEEKKRGDELAKLLEKATNSRPEKNTLLEATTTADVEVPKEKTKNVNERVKTSADAPEADAPKSKDTTLKIKIVKNNEEVQLEGNWSQINPALEQIVQLIDKSRADTNRKPSCSDVRSGVSTPDASTIRRVNEIENEIFKEIEEIEKVQIGNDNNDAREDQEIARKRGRPPLKKTAMPIKTNASANDEDKRVDKLEVPTRRSTRTPKSDTSEISNKNSPETKKRLTKNVENTDNSDAYEIRYKFPSPPKETTRRRAPPRAR